MKISHVNDTCFLPDSTCKLHHRAQELQVVLGTKFWIYQCQQHKQVVNDRNDGPSYIIRDDSWIGS